MAERDFAGKVFEFFRNKFIIQTAWPLVDFPYVTFQTVVSGTIPTGHEADEISSKNKPQIHEAHY